APALNGDNNPNLPFRGHKGEGYEGGIRTPAFIKAPGLTPGVYNKPVTAYDYLPTLVDAAGGDSSQFQGDGYDVMPLLTGQQTTDPHQVMFWRVNDIYAVRKGDWKLTRPSTNSGDAPFLYNIKNDPGETVVLNNSQIPILIDLHRELT